MMDTVYVCAKCGETTADWEYIDDWLIADNPHKPGEMVIRCPQHITEYAIHKAGGHFEQGEAVVGDWRYLIVDWQFGDKKGRKFEARERMR